MESIEILKVPERSEWECHLFGSRGGDGITYQPSIANEPNWFHRQMMWLILDCKWVRRKP